LAHENTTTIPDSNGLGFTITSSTNKNNNSNGNNNNTYNKNHNIFTLRHSPSSMNTDASSHLLSHANEVVSVPPSYDRFNYKPNLNRMTVMNGPMTYQSTRNYGNSNHNSNHYGDYQGRVDEARCNLNIFPMGPAIPVGSASNNVTSNPNLNALSHRSNNMNASNAIGVSYPTDVSSKIYGSNMYPNTTITNTHPLLSSQPYPYSQGIGNENGRIRNPNPSHGLGGLGLDYNYIHTSNSNYNHLSGHGFGNKPPPTPDYVASSTLSTHHWTSPINTPSYSNSNFNNINSSNSNKTHISPNMNTNYNNVNVNVNALGYQSQEAAHLTKYHSYSSNHGYDYCSPNSSTTDDNVSNISNNNNNKIKN
jgi:hypothetical protein